MRFLLCPDSFKGSLSAEEVGECLASGILLADPRHEIQICPLADGGEGSATLLAKHFKAQEIMCATFDPYFRPIQAPYFMDQAQATAYIEMAAASGYERLQDAERNATKTSTFGTGTLILDAITKGAKKVVLCLGGSATHDGGIGMASALGWQFLNEAGEVLVPTGESLNKIAQIVPPSLNPCAGISFVAATDVRNPLYGPKGAAYIFAPQKGATAHEVDLLDQGVRHLEKQLQGLGLHENPQQAGSGAAGGLGFGAKVFLQAQLVLGIDFILDTLEFDTLLRNADVVITGEGRIDAQSLDGKVISGVSLRCQTHSKPLLAVCGTFDLPAQAQIKLGLSYASSCISAPMPLSKAIQHTPEWLQNWGFNAAMLLALTSTSPFLGKKP